jgi:NADH:ubiquinone oxidoreductase subunit H
VFTTVFLSGWEGPVLPPWIWFLLKSFAMFFVMMWIKFTLPRFRIDQLMAFNWKFLVPVAVVNLLVLAIADSLLKMVGLSRTASPWAWGLILFAINLVMLVVALGMLGRSAGRRRLAQRRVVARMDDVAPAGTAPASN